MFGKIPDFLFSRLPLLSGGAAKVYMALVLRCDFHTRKVAVSYTTLMRDTGIKDRHTVSSALDKLEEIGAISKIPGKKGVSNRYYLPLEESSTSAENLHYLLDDNQCGKSTRGSAENPHGVVRKIHTHDKKEIYNKRAQAAQPHGQAAPAPVEMCPECGLALQPDGTCWRHGKLAPGKEKDTSIPAYPSF